MAKWGTHARFIVRSAHGVIFAIPAECEASFNALREEDDVPDYAILLTGKLGAFSFTDPRVE